MEHFSGSNLLKGLFSLSIFSFYSCQSPVTEYPISSGVKLHAPSNSVDSLFTTPNICQLFNEKWDSILVVNPYIVPESIKSLSVKNYTAISSKVDMQSLGDMTCTLLFTYKGTYVGYNVLSRGSVDFVPLVASKKSQYAWISKSQCNKVEIIMSPKKPSLIAQFK